MKAISSPRSSRVHKSTLRVMWRPSDRRGHLLDRSKISLQGYKLGFWIVVGGLPYEDVRFGARKSRTFPEFEAGSVLGGGEKPRDNRVTSRVGCGLDRKMNHHLLDLPPHRA